MNEIVRGWDILVDVTPGKTAAEASPTAPMRAQEAEQVRCLRETPKKQGLGAGLSISDMPATCRRRVGSPMRSAFALCRIPVQHA